MNLNILKRWWRDRSEKVENSQGIYSNTLSFNCANCETSARFSVPTSIAVEGVAVMKSWSDQISSCVNKNEPIIGTIFYLYSSEKQKDTTEMFRLKPVFLYLSKGRFLQNLASNSLCDVLLCFSFVWGTKREGESCHRFRQHWTEESHLQTVVQLRELATAFLYLGSTIFLGKKKAHQVSGKD